MRFFEGRTKMELSLTLLLFIWVVVSFSKQALDAGIQDTCESLCAPYTVESCNMRTATCRIVGGFETRVKTSKF